MNDNKTVHLLIHKLSVSTCTIYVTKATNEVVTRVPEATQAEMQSAVDSAKAAFAKWADTTILTRQQIMFNFQQLIKDNMVSTRLMHTSVKC